MEEIKLSGEQALSVDLTFAHLIVVGVGAKTRLGRDEGSLKGGIRHHAEGIQVAEVEVPAFHLSGAEGAAAEGKVRIQPAVGRDEELRPVVRPHGGRRYGEAGLPAGRNAGDPAHGDEQEGLHAAVALPADGAGLRDIIQQEIFRHIGIGHLRGDKVVDPPRFFQRIALFSHNLGGEGAQIGREADMGRLLPGIEVGKTVGNAVRIRLNIPYRAVVFIFHPEGVVLLRGLPERHGPCGSVRGTEERGPVPGVQDAHAVYGIAFLRNGKMDQIFLLRFKEFILYAQSGFEMDAVSQQAFFLQEPDGAVAEPAAVVHIPDELRIRPARENGIHGEKGVQKTAGIALLSLQENRLRPSFPFQSMEFLFRKIRDPGTDQGQGFRKGIGVFKGKLGKTGELKRQAAFFLPLFPGQGTVGPVQTLQIKLDPFARFLQTARRDQAADVCGERNRQRLYGIRCRQDGLLFCRVHGGSFLQRRPAQPQLRFCRRSGSGVSALILSHPCPQEKHEMVPGALPGISRVTVQPSAEQ